MSAPVFITYNPKSEIAERTALRLQTISNLYGFTVHLPYRPSAQNITTESKVRIDKSQFIVAFSLEKPSAKMQADITYAITKGKPIVVVYKSGERNKLNLPKGSKEIELDFNDPSAAQHELAEYISGLKNRTKTQKKDSGLGIALVTVGIALLAAWALSEDEK